MRILFVNERYGYFGGIEQNVADTAGGLRARGHQCFLAYGTETDRGDVEGYGDIFDGAYKCSDLGPDPSAKSFEEIVAAASPDVAYLHKFAALAPLEKGTRGNPERARRA